MTPLAQLLWKMIAPDNMCRIGEWINWNAIAEADPDRYKVCRVGLDFVLMERQQRCPYFWLVLAISAPIVERAKEKTLLRIISE